VTDGRCSGDLERGEVAVIDLESSSSDLGSSSSSGGVLSASVSTTAASVSTTTTSASATATTEAFTGDRGAFLSELDFNGNGLLLEGSLGLGRASEILGSVLLILILLHELLGISPARSILTLSSLASSGQRDRALRLLAEKLFQRNLLGLIILGRIGFNSRGDDGTIGFLKNLLLAIKNDLLVSTPVHGTMTILAVLKGALVALTLVLLGRANTSLTRKTSTTRALMLGLPFEGGIVSVSLRCSSRNSLGALLARRLVGTRCLGSATGNFLLRSSLRLGILLTLGLGSLGDLSLLQDLGGLLGSSHRRLIIILHHKSLEGVARH